MSRLKLFSRHRDGELTAFRWVSAVEAGIAGSSVNIGVAIPIIRRDAVACDNVARQAIFVLRKTDWICDRRHVSGLVGHRAVVWRQMVHAMEVILDPRGQVHELRFHLRDLSSVGMTCLNDFGKFLWLPRFGYRFGSVDLMRMTNGWLQTCSRVAHW